MKLFLILGLWLGVMSLHSLAQGVEVNPDAIRTILKEEFDQDFKVSTRRDLNMITLVSQSGDRIVDWYINLQEIFAFNGLSLLIARRDKLGRSMPVYHCLVEDNLYKLHLSEDTVMIKTNATFRAAHYKLIKRWINYLEVVVRHCR